MRIALDAMGGDRAPEVTVEGALQAVNEYPYMEIILVGESPTLVKELSNKKYPKTNITIVHAGEFIAMDEPISYAMMRKKDSSIRRAVELLRQGSADAVVSAGHSGITMAIALLLLGTSEGVHRPAIAVTMPTVKKPFVLIDAGANVDCSPQNLLQFALMSDAYTRLILGRSSPKIALMSIGAESTKGNELTKEAFKLLKKAKINFIGNIEGKDIFLGKADVVICDGFTGNVVLKTSEGLAEASIKMLKREIAGMIIGKLVYLLFLKPALRRFKKQTDYAEYGGAPLLGINGTCIICHGHSNPKAIKNAIKMAEEFSKKKVYEAIAEEIADTETVERSVAAG